MDIDFSLNWAYAYGEPQVKADFRCVPEDFFVDELLDFEFTGSGEHVVLHLQKRGDNTDWLARQIAKLAGVGPADVGYCGLKDRHAVTRQWFSVYLPKGDEPDWQQLNSESVQLLRVDRHCRKLRRGSHLGNRFELVLRNLDGRIETLSQRLSVIAEQGVPNYFGEQRFGREAGNLELANRLLVEGQKINNRQRRTMAMSAARSYLFNSVLSRRVQEKTWDTELEGDPEDFSGPLWGRGRPLSQGVCLELEEAVLAPMAAWRDGMEHVGLKQERRGLRLLPDKLNWQLDDEQLQLSFALPPGTYATAILRELCYLRDVSQAQVVL
ncbi:MAG: tRNA pseudouridine(13) synthase TruD [Candidatus Pelagadaptatus aseana]